MAGSRISVEVAGTSASLQAAVGKAADSLKGLGDVLSKQTDLAISLGDRTVSMNELVAKSYESAAGAAGVASDRTIAAFERQGAVILDSSRTTKAELAATAEAAKASSDEQVSAAGRAGDASLTSASKHEQAAKRSEAAFGSSSSALTKAGKVITLGLIGAAAASVDLAVKFQSNTLRMQTQAGATTRQLAQLRQGLLNMASVVGYTPNQLADGMYHVVSSMNAVLPATKRVSTELSVLRAAAQGAQIGHSNLEDTTYALASAMNALHAPGSQAAHVMGQLNAIVGAGDMTMQDLIDSFKSGLVPGAREAGVSMQSLGAALAVMGDMGMRGSLAGTRLRMSIALLSSPSEAAAKVLQTLGLTASQATSTSAAMAAALEKAGLRTTQLSQDLKQPDGIQYALADLNAHLRESGLTATGAAAVMSKAFGGGRMGATITLLAQNTDRLSTKFRQIGQSAGEFGTDWQRTSHTTSVELHQVEGGLLALGTRIGTGLLPDVDAAIHDFSEFVDWLQKGSTEAHALELAVGAFATVAIGSYFTSRIKQAITLVQDFKSGLSWIGAKVGMGGGLTPASAGTGGGIGGLASEAMGAHPGGGAPFTIMNPGVVAIEAGEYAGLGSMGAAGTVSNEMSAAKAETGAVSEVSRGGVVLPSGVAGAEARAAASGALSAEETASAGILSTLKTGLGSVLSGAVRGAGVAGVGVLGSQLVGSAIGGSAGHAVSQIGTGASIGAGIGTAIEPGIGTALGAALGGVGAEIARLFSHESFGQQEAGRLERGAHHPAYSASSEQQIAQAIDRMAAIVHPGQRTVARGVGAHAEPIKQEIDLSVNQLSPDQLAKYMAAARQAGGEIAKQLEAGWNQYKFQSEPVMFTQLKAQLAGMPPAVQATAVQSAVAFAEGLQKEGRLGPDAAAALLSETEKQFPAFEQYLGLAGKTSIDQFNKALDFSHAQAGLGALLDSFRSDFPQVTAAMDSAGADIDSQASAVMQALHGIVSGPNSTAAMRAQATQDLQQLQQHVSSTFSAMLSDTESKQAAMTQAIASGSAQAAQIAGQNYSQFAAAVQKAMNAGALATSDGMRMIAQAMNATIKALGGTPIPVPQLVSAQTLAASAGAGMGVSQLVSSGAGAFLPHAFGGFIGNQGESGRDQVPILAGRGEAVLNDTHQGIVNTALAATPYGSLDGVFAATRGSLHGLRGMAAGGYVDPIPGFSLGRTDMGVDADAAPGSPILSIGDSRLVGVIPDWNQGQPLLDFELLSGPDKGRFWYVAEQIAPVTEMIGALFKAGQVVARFASQGTGIEIGWAAGPSGQTLAQGTTGYSEGEQTQAGASFRSFLGGLAQGKVLAGGPGATMIATPKVKGAGVIAQIAQAALSQAAGAANAYLAGAGAGSTTATGKLVPGIMSIEQQAAQMAGLAFNAMIVGALLSHESSGGVNEPPTGPLQATGPNQVIPGTFRQYALPGHTNIANPLDNAIASFRYIKARYGSLAAMAAQTGLLTGGYHGYGGGGFVRAAGGWHDSSGTRFTSHTLHSNTTRPPKPGAAPKGLATGMTTKDMQELSKVGGKIATIEAQVVDVAGRYSADQTLFGPQEGAAQYLNPDGSLNAAGYAKKISDDQTLLALDEQQLGLDMEELPIVSAALKKWLGSQKADTSKVAANKAKIAANKLKESSLRKAILDLQKPTLNRVSAIELSIAGVKQQFAEPIHSAQDALAHYNDSRSSHVAALRQAILHAEENGGTSSKTNPSLAAARQALSAYEANSATGKTGLTEALQTQRDNEFAALQPLQSALLDAKAAQLARKFSIATKVYGLRQQLQSLSSQDLRLGNVDSTISGALTGAGGGTSTNATVNLLETVASRLGMVNWSNGNFVSIDTTMPGDVVSLKANMQSLSNDIGTAQTDQSGAATANEAQLVTLLQQQNLQLSEALSLNEAQTSVLAGMIPSIPHYAQGGPVLDDSLAMVHRGEYVVPQGGALVSGGGGGGPTTVELHQHFHGQAGELMDLIDQRIQHPDNVRAVSRQIGNRTSMLARAPGSRRLG